MRASAQVMAPGAVTSMIVAVSTRPNRQNRNRCSRMSVNQPSGEFGLRMYCSILSGSLGVLTRKGGECNQSCQQYRSDNSISPKPATKRFLIFRIELLIFVDELSAHRTPPSLYGVNKCTPLHGLGRCDGHHETVDLRPGKIGARRRSEEMRIEIKALVEQCGTALRNRAD